MLLNRFNGVYLNSFLTFGSQFTENEYIFVMDLSRLILQQRRNFALQFGSTSFLLSTDYVQRNERNASRGVKRVVRTALTIQL
jgi:hypothetical protein